jgi:predicted RecB family nuclease
MQWYDDKPLYSPSDLVQFVQSEFATWMNRYSLIHAVESTEVDPLLDVLCQLGDRHEKEYLLSLEQAGIEVYKIDSRGGYTATIAAMKAGAPYIYQAALRGGNWIGFADFLIRVNEPSDLGAWSYIPLECKLALNPKPYFVIQACAYCELLGAIQGRQPDRFALLLGDRQLQYFDRADYSYYVAQLRLDFLAMMTRFDPNQRPIPTIADHGSWQKVADQDLLDRDHLSLVANISRSQIRRLEADGVNSISQLAELDRPVSKLKTAIRERLVSQAQLQCEARSGDPTYRLLPVDPASPDRGLGGLPPASKLDIFFDMEGYPLGESGGLEYLFGATVCDGNTLKFQDWWAHDRASEGRAFEAFIDWVIDRWHRDPNLHIYHYAPYEPTALKRLMGRHGTREAELDALLRGKVFVDLYRVVSQGLQVGEPAYSIKNLERFYGRQRAGDVATAQDSVIQYFQWQQVRDGDRPEDSAILASIRDYNREDCDSTYELACWLRTLQTESGIRYCSQPIDPPELGPINNPDDQLSIDILEIANELEIAEDSSLKIPEILPPSIQRLLAHLLNFHRRESRPFWWQRYLWMGMDERDLYDETDCWAGLIRTDRPVFDKPSKKASSKAASQCYEYQFDPEQDCQLKEATSCWFSPEDIIKNCKIEAIDRDQNYLTLAIGPSHQDKAERGRPNWQPPGRLNLIDCTYIDTKSIAQAIAETVQIWRDSGQLQPALADFLARRSPRFKPVDIAYLPISGDAEAQLQGTIAAVSALDNSALCIQGPPGSGKTYTASQLILELLKQGKTIAISANSHAVILNLLERAQRSCIRNQVSVKIAKVQTKKPDNPIPGIDYGTSIDKLKGDYQLVGATVFQLCKVVDRFDYLFIDEAGQMSIANFVAMARCARNLVLMGDPMQLEQPIQGTHPGESGQSALGYLLQGRATIPPDLGIFLRTSYRMHPSLCRFISEGIYEGRLDAHPDTVTHEIKSSSQDALVQSGLYFLPIDHQDNTKESAEEVEAIAQLVNRLTGLDYCSDRGSKSGQIGRDDILIVAPYNAQVNRLTERLGDRARIGTVDRFQGQEAPIVILSMCTSSLDQAPRGLEFLLNRNRLNVAISRGQCAAIVVANPQLASAHCTTLEQMIQINLFCKLLAKSQWLSLDSDPRLEIQTDRPT